MKHPYLIQLTAKMPSSCWPPGTYGAKSTSHICTACSCPCAETWHKKKGEMEILVGYWDGGFFLERGRFGSIFELVFSVFFSCFVFFCLGEWLCAMIHEGVLLTKKSTRRRPRVESCRSVVAVRRIACRVMGLQSFCPRMEVGQWADL